MTQRRQLEQKFFETFAGKGQILLSVKHLTKLTQQQCHSVEDIFKARYEDIYISNIPNKKVFEKTIKDLQSIIDASERPKVKSKSKPAIVVQSEIYLNHYLQLLFTDNQKKALNKMIKNNFQNQEEDEIEENQNSTELASYILKGIFGIKGKEDIESEEQEEVYQARHYYPAHDSFDFD